MAVGNPLRARGYRCALHDLGPLAQNFPPRIEIFTDRAAGELDVRSFVSMSGHPSGCHVLKAAVFNCHE